MSNHISAFDPPLLAAIFSRPVRFMAKKELFENPIIRIALFLNGALLGALTALVYLRGNPLTYWSLILPHGIIELTAIFISGAAGLLIAKHIILPGRYSRKDALIAGAKQAVSLMSGVVIMLVIAGLIEGFFTPRAVGAEMKLIFAGATGLSIISYLLLPYFQRE